MVDSDDAQDRGPAPCYADRPKAKAPWQVPVAAGAWALLALLVITAAVGRRSAESPDDATVSQIEGALGDSAVSSQQPTGVPTLVLVMLGLVLLVGALAVVARQGRLLIPLVAIGALGVVLLALDGSWATLPAIVLLVVGALPLLSARAHRWLTHR